MTSVNSLISLLCLFPEDLSIGESGVLKSPTISEWGLMCCLSFSNISSTSMGAFLFGA